MDFITELLGLFWQFAIDAVVALLKLIVSPFNWIAAKFSSRDRDKPE